MHSENAVNRTCIDLICTGYSSESTFFHLRFSLCIQLHRNELLSSCMPCVYFERFCGTDSGLKGKQYNEEDEEEKNWNYCKRAATEHLVCRKIENHRESVVCFKRHSLYAICRVPRKPFRKSVHRIALFMLSAMVSVFRLLLLPFCCTVSSYFHIWCIRKMFVLCVLFIESSYIYSNVSKMQARLSMNA